MTKEQYITQLKKYLRRLPKQDYDDAIEYFEEYFGEADEAGQQKLMEELGTPKEAARDLISNLLDKKLDDKSSFEKPVRKGTARHLCCTGRNSHADCIICPIVKCRHLYVCCILIYLRSCTEYAPHRCQTFCPRNYCHSFFCFRKFHYSWTRAAWYRSQHSVVHPWNLSVQVDLHPVRKNGTAFYKKKEGLIYYEKSESQ